MSARHGDNWEGDNGKLGVIGVAISQGTLPTLPSSHVLDSDQKQADGYNDGLSHG